MESGLYSPLNPIIGETMVKKTERGSIIYAEQTSHHPPISNFLLEGPPEFPFTISGHVQFKLGVKMGFTAAVFHAPGKYTINLPDKSRIELEGKTVEVTGLMSNSKNFNATGTLTYTDVTKKYKSTT